MASFLLLYGSGRNRRKKRKKIGSEENNYDRKHRHYRCICSVYGSDAGHRCFMLQKVKQPVRLPAGRQGPELLGSSDVGPGVGYVGLAADGSDVYKRQHPMCDTLFIIQESLSKSKKKRLSSYPFLLYFRILCQKSGWIVVSPSQRIPFKRIKVF